MIVMIEILNDEQAERFLTWIKFRGDIVLGDAHDGDGYAPTNEVTSNPKYVYINSATEVSKNEPTGRHSRTVD